MRLTNFSSSFLKEASKIYDAEIWHNGPGRGALEIKSVI